MFDIDPDADYSELTGNEKVHRPIEPLPSIHPDGATSDPSDERCLLSRGNGLDFFPVQQRISKPDLYAMQHLLRGQSTMEFCSPFLKHSRLLSPLFAIILFPSPALAQWGNTDWGTMLWGSASVPLLSPIGLTILFLCLLIGGWIRVYPRRTVVMTSALLITIPLVAVAASVPNTFTNGTIADANEVNANFSALTDAITPLQCFGNTNSGDTDRDGFCDDIDLCNGFRDDTDVDNDGTPDGCDPCPLSNPNDANGNSICDSNELLPFPSTSGAPPPAQCDAFSRRTSKFDAAAGILYVCGNAGWVAK